jgi:hypothetical protein
MKSVLSIVIAVLLSAGFLPEVFAAVHPVPDGKVAVLIGQDSATIERYIKKTGHVPAGFMIYTAIHEPEGLDTWSRDYGAGRSSADDLLSKYPGKAVQIGLYMVDSLQKTYRGEFDENIARLARWMKKANAPVFLRIGYEFDGPHNRYDPDDYKKAYTYIVDKFREAGVANVDYVWHSCAQDDVRDILPWYPGDDYVDWVGLSYFDQPQSFMTHVVDFAEARGKPLMVAEATPAGKSLNSPLAWKIWFQPFFRFVDKNDIRIISYINSHWDAMPMWQEIKWGDARIEAHDNVRAQWLNKMKEDRFRFNW